MKIIYALAIMLILAFTLAAGCIGNTAAPTPTPAPKATPTPTPTPAPTITATPKPSLPLTPVIMPEQTTNGQASYPAPSIAGAVDNSTKGGQIHGELGRQ